MKYIELTRIDRECGKFWWNKYKYYKHTVNVNPEKVVFVQDFVDTDALKCSAIYLDCGKFMIVEGDRQHTIEKLANNE